MKKTTIIRALIYISGLLILALGIILNTKSGLGVSPIISVSYSISTILHMNFGNMTFLLYAIFVLIELILHIIRYTRIPQRVNKKEYEVLRPSIHKSLSLVLLSDLLQLPLSLVFTRFMNLFSQWIASPVGNFGLQFVVLLAGIILTGIGAAMSLNMRIIPNPGDGIVQAIADCINKPVGLMKNCFDLLNISITICVSLGVAHHLIGIGIGTVISVLGVGRIIALFNHLYMEKMIAAADVE